MAADRTTPSAGRAISAVPYLPGLDGVRALAVVAVILYHAGVSWLPGGFLGVEVFFVISGYLITLLLLAEHERTGRISIKDFYIRRARRLLPAAVMLLIVTATLYSVLPFLRSSLGRQRGALFWGFFYGSNWFQIARKQSYFDATERPPLLRHLWSLAVEEQFYLVWPLLMVVIIALFRRRLPQIGMVFLALALGSAFLMAALYDPVNPNRAYLGTDTRASGLLLGAAMSMVWRPYAVARGPLRDRGRLMSLVGIVGGVVLLVCHTRFHDVVETPDGVRGYDPLYRGGLLVVGLATMAVIASTTHMQSWFGQKVLGCRPLAWLGTRSYGLYLWHWPVFQLTRPGAIDEGGDIDWPWWVLMVIRLAVTCVLTEVSYRFIEQPIRQRKVKRWLRGFVSDQSPRAVFRRRRVGVAGVALGIVGLFVGVSVATASYQPTAIEESLAEGASAANDITDLRSTPTPAAQDAEAPSPTEPEEVPETSPGETLPSTTTIPPTTIAKFPILAIGDSVMLGAAPDLRNNGVWVDAEVSRQVVVGIERLREYAAMGVIGDVVVIHLGTNGPSSQEKFDEIIEVLKDVRLVLILTVKAPRPWEADNNSYIWNLQDRPNVKLIDWNGLSQTQGGIFYGDGIHLTNEGQLIYTSYVMDTIKANS